MYHATKHVLTETMVQRSSRDTRSASRLWDDIVEYKILGAWERLILHFCIPKTQVRIYNYAALITDSRKL